MFTIKVFSTIEIFQQKNIIFSARLQYLLTLCSKKVFEIIKKNNFGFLCCNDSQRVRGIEPKYDY